MKTKVRWAGVAFLVFTAGIGFIAAPLYIFWYGVSFSEIALFVFFNVATMMAITVGYHRLYAHAAFKAHPLLQFFILMFGAAAFEQSALRWASLHRTHHRFVDTEKDPYNIKRGFFYAHIGWIISGKPTVDFQNTADLQKNSLVMFQHKYYQRLALLVGLILPLGIGYLSGHILGAALLAMGARLALVHHSTFFINSFAHTFGTSDYDPDSSAKDNWFGAVLTNGEGYHNYHHRFPSDYRNGIRWHHWDPTKWMIWGLSKAGLISGLLRTPAQAILEAKAFTRSKKMGSVLAA
jgi:stearoyl-CoA desaturase (delta-9 desaturase)